MAVVGEGPDAAALAAAARAGTSPGLVVVVGSPDAPGVPLLADRPLVGGAAAAYVCRGFVCEQPTTDPDALRAAVGARGADADALTLAVGRTVRPALGCREAQRMVTPGAVASSVATASRHPLSPGGR